MLLQKIALGLIIVGIGICGYCIARGSSQKTYTTTVPRKYGAIVRLTNKGRTFCSGTVVSPSLIVTAAHCVLKETFAGVRLTDEDIEIRPVDNTDLRIEASPISAVVQMDTAILHGDFSDFEIKEIITDPAILTHIRQHNTKFISCGYPLHGDLYCNTTTDPIPYNFAWKVSGVLLPGMSGGPTMLEDGTIVAINVAVEGKFSIVSPTYNALSSIEAKK